MSQSQLYLNECITVVGSHTTCQFRSLNTLRTGDADLRFYISTMQDG